MQNGINNLNPIKNKTYAVILLVFLIQFSNCKKEKNCSAFDSNDTSEFSYTKLDTITFENETSEQFQIFIKKINLSEAYSLDCRDLYQICPCTNYIEAEATDSKTQIPYSFLRMEQSDVSEMQYFKYNIQGYLFEFDFINELPNIDQMPHLVHYNSFTIENTVYNDVIVITNSDFQNNDIFQVYFNKQNGVLRFIEKSTNSVWNIKN